MKHIITAVLTAIQIILVGALIQLERLSKTRALVMRHLYTRRLEHTSTFLTPENQGYLLLALVLCFIAVNIYAHKKGQALVKRLPYLLITLTTCLMYWTDWFSGLLVFSYLWLVMGILALIEIMKVLKTYG